MAKYFDAQRREETQTHSSLFANQQPLCQKLKRDYPAINTVIDPQEINPLTIRLLILDDHFKKICNELRNPTLDKSSISHVPALSFQERIPDDNLPASMPPYDPTVSGTQVPLLPLGSSATPSQKEVNPSLIYRELFGFLFHLGSVSDRLAFEITQLFKPPTAGWPNATKCSWVTNFDCKSPQKNEIFYAINKIVPKSTRQSIKDARMFRNRVTHDGYIVLNMGAPVRIAPEGEPSKTTNILECTVPLNNKINNWYSAIFKAADVIYKTVLSAETIPAALPVLQKNGGVR